MPIRPENRDLYGPGWNQFSDYIRFERAAGRCECRGECGRPAGHLAADGRCRNRHGQPAWTGPPTGQTDLTGAVAPAPAGPTVVLTVAHRNHQPEQRGDDEVMAACPGCHLNYDIDHHRETAARTRTAAIAAQHYPLWDTDDGPGTHVPEPEQEKLRVPQRQHRL